MAKDRTEVVLAELVLPGERRIGGSRRQDEPAPKRLYDAWLRKKKATTVKAYKRDLAQFAGWLKEEGYIESSDAVVAIEWLMKNRRNSNEALQAYSNEMEKGGVASASINRYLSSVRSIFKLGVHMDFCSWELWASPPKIESRKDVSGPKIEDAKSIIEYFEEKLANADDDQKPLMLRDRSIVSLMLLGGLRRSEVASLRMEDVRDGRVFLLGKGKNERIAVPIPRRVFGFLKEWMAWREKQFFDKEAVFIALDFYQRGHELSASAIYKLVKKLGPRALGKPLWPHALRHRCITSANTKKGFAAAVIVARHKDPKTTMRYIDDKEKIAEDTVRAIEDDLFGE